MAIFRKIHTTIWSDSWFSQLEKDEKLFYLYLLTNERTHQCGIYEITIRQISFDLDYDNQKVKELINSLVKQGKIKYNSKTNEIAIGNWFKYNNSTSKLVQSCINKGFEYTKDTILIEYVKSMDTHSQQEEEQEENKNKIPEFLDFKIYALEKKPTIDLEALNLKYQSWIEGGWKNGNGKKIINWKSTLLNTLPYIKETKTKDFQIR